MSNVQCYLYDLSKGVARSMSTLLLGRQIDGIWHTSIIAYGKEYFFGGNGIAWCQPGTTHLGPPMEVIPLGRTEIDQETFEMYIKELSEDAFAGSTYKLFEHNCNNFSSETAQFLTGNDIPSHITQLPSEVLATPFGQMIKQAMENVKIDPTSSQQAGSFMSK